MKIIDAIKSEDGPILKNGFRWLEWSVSSDCFIIYERGYHKKKNTVVVETKSEEVAIDILMQG